MVPYKEHWICPKMGCQVPMNVDKIQRFGRLVKSFGDYGELRRQKKAPNLEVFYIPVPMTQGKGDYREALRSVKNCATEQIAEFTKKVGEHLSGGAISQENAETVLDYCYAELNRRLNP